MTTKNKEAPKETKTEAPPPAKAEPDSVPKNIHHAFQLIRAEVARIGISKDRVNQGGGNFKYRGIDDTYNALGPILARFGVNPLWNWDWKSMVITERETSKGGVMRHCMLYGDVVFVSVHDGTTISVPLCGEAADSGDKLVAKARSIAIKQCFFETFTIPVEGADHDPDAQSHEFKARKGGEVEHEEVKRDVDAWRAKWDAVNDGDAYKAMCEEWKTAPEHVTDKSNGFGKTMLDALERAKVHAALERDRARRATQAPAEKLTKAAALTAIQTAGNSAMLSSISGVIAEDKELHADSDVQQAIYKKRLDLSEAEARK